jgi:hypothetical protein
LKRLILILFAVAALSGCIKEDTWCPTMYVSFALQDDFLKGDFDSRIGNDVLLYIFQDDILTCSRSIPYDSIAGGKSYAIPKTPAMLGDVKLVAWAVKRDVMDQYHDSRLEIHNERHSNYAMDTRFEDQFVTQSMLGEYYTPIHYDRYLGVTEPIGEITWKEHSHHDVVLQPATGRIIVNITDPGNLFGNTEGESHVVVNGVMSKMNLNKEGIGTRAAVRTALNETSAATRAAGGPTHTTDMFGVLPSKSGQTLSIEIMNGTQRLETLSVYTDDNLHQSIEAGDLLVFDYTLKSSTFTLTVGNWSENITIVKGM